MTDVIKTYGDAVLVLIFDPMIQMWLVVFDI